MHRELRGIDGQLRQVANGREHLALLADTPADGLLSAQRMRAARLAEAANNGVVVRFHENQPRGNLTADARIDSREPLEASTRSKSPSRRRTSTATRSVSASR